MSSLTRLEIAGFKSIRYVDLGLKRMSVLIGPNAAGKSNLISFFSLVNWMTAAPGNLQLHVGQQGGASSLLLDGPGVTPQLEATLTFETDTGSNDYGMRLFHAAADTLVFADERLRYTAAGSQPSSWQTLGAGHRESELFTAADRGDVTARTVLFLLRQCVVHQFHDTSATARVRQRWRSDDNRFLKRDAANLAPMLLRLRDTHPAYYAGITENLRLVYPGFADFVLEPDNGSLLLQWREQGSDMVFGPHQASDGTLRTMALITLLLQPPVEMPSILIVDEPELGLHPAAIDLVVGLLQSASLHHQVLLATQSPALVNLLAPEDIVIVERHGRESTFHRLDADHLSNWLNEYSLAELWDKNVLGGRP